MKKIIGIVILSLLAGQTMSADKNSKKETKEKKEICISFDQLPASIGFQEVDRDAITYLIQQALTKYEVKAVGFVVGEQIDESFDILGEWLNNGHTLGSMTFSNQDYNQLGISQFIEDVSRGDNELDIMLQGFGQKKRWFKYF